MLSRKGKWEVVKILLAIPGPYFETQGVGLASFDHSSVQLDAAED